MITILADVISAIRVRQWVKNLLLLGAPVGAATQPTISNLSIFLKGFTIFCLISSAGYILNDWVDREKDKLHEYKQKRPFADGRLNGIHAIAVGAFLVILSYFLSSELPNSFLFWVATYVVSTFCYSVSFKRKPVIELINVAFGFLVRCLAGAALFEVSVSQWFLIVSGFGSLFLICSKRLAELKVYENFQTRDVLSSYSEKFLNSIISVSISITIMAYALWAFEVVGNNNWGKLSILPVLLGVLRYLWHAESSDAETPEKAIFSDSVIPLAGISATFLLILAIYE